MISDKEMIENVLKEELVYRILAKLGINHRPSPDLHGLKAIYSAWCSKVPFDNIRKRIHLESGSHAPLPGDDPIDFFKGWLNFGTGGTCWAGSGALYTLLASLGFSVFRGVATMLVSPDLPPNHGTVFVRCDSSLFLVDTSILHTIPLRLNDHSKAQITHPAWSINGEIHSGDWHIRWRPLHMLDGCDCRIDKTSATHQLFVCLNEETRRWGPFNYSLYLRINRGDSVVGVAYGHRVTIDAVGAVDRKKIDAAERSRFLIEEMGIDEIIVNQLPPDKPTPSPPESKLGKRLKSH